jgi:hypothetical protein
MFQMHQHTEIKSGHVAKRQRSAEKSGKKRQKSAQGGRLSLDNRGPHKCYVALRLSLLASNPYCHGHWRIDPHQRVTSPTYP